MWHVGNGLKMYQLWIDRVFMTANGFKPRQLKDDILDVCVTSNCRVVRLDTRLHFSSAKVLPRRVRPSIIVALHPAQRASSVADRICSVSRISCLQTGSNGERGETKSGLFLFPIVKGRIPSHNVARAFHLLATDRGCGLTRMPGGPGATVEAIVRSGVGDEKIPLVSGGTTAEPHGRDRWLGGATRRATSTSMLLVGVHLKTGNFENFWEQL